MESHCTYVQERIVQLIERWLGPQCVVVSCRIHSPAPAIHPAEASLLAHATLQRRIEFATGRWCAHAALERLGAPTSVIGIGERREPIWPGGFTGSITHDGDLCLAVAGPTTRCDAIGVDLVALTDHWPQELNALVAQELDELTRVVIGNRDNLTPGQLLFSIKEAAIKACSHIIGRWIDFVDLQVVVDGNTFRVSVKGFRGVAMKGWWSNVGKYLICLAEISSPSESFL